MKGSPPAPQLASDVQRSLAIFSGVENRYLEGWNRFAQVLQQAATVGQQSAIRLRNPTNSGVVVVFEKLSIHNQNAAAVQGHNFQIGPITTDYGTAAAPTLASLDARQTSNSILIITKTGAGASVNVGFSLATTMLPVSGNYDVILEDDQEVTLLPGWALQPISSNVNEILTVACMWRERPLEDSEKF